jgi:Ca2+-binding RTX toxin-like protein
VAIATVSSNVNVLSSIIGFMGSEGDDMRATTTTSTTFVAQNTSGYTGVLSGVGLTYGNEGLAGGTITSMELSRNGQSLMKLEGLSVPGNLNVYDTGYDGNARGATSEFAYWLRGNDTITGSSGNEVLYAFGGNDRLIGGKGDDTLYGGKGVDTAVFSGVRSAYQISANKTTVMGPDGTDTLIDIERLEFDDVTIALDISGTAGQAYRLYQAAFNRTPDKDGLGYWVKQLDAGHSLQTAASAFTQSGEFVALYGSSDPAAAVLIEKMYQNVMHRASDAGGYNYWMGKLASGAVDKNSLLVNFSESAENQANVIGVIQGGIEF